MCVTSLGWAYGKIRKRRCQYSWQLQKKWVKEDWGHIDPMVPQQGQTCTSHHHHHHHESGVFRTGDHSAGLTTPKSGFDTRRLFKSPQRPHCLWGFRILVQWNLVSRTPLFTNNSVHEQIFRAKTSRMTNGVSDYEHASWQQRQAESIVAGVLVAG
jgi:hypothetical protein